MVTIDLKGQAVRVNQSKIRKNPDNWHDVVIPGLHGRDGVVTVPSLENKNMPSQRPTKRIMKKTSPGGIPKPTPSPSTPIMVDPVYEPQVSPDFEDEETELFGDFQDSTDENFYAKNNCRDHWHAPVKDGPRDILTRFFNLSLIHI